MDDVCGSGGQKLGLRKEWGSYLVEFGMACLGFEI